MTVRQSVFSIDRRSLLRLASAGAAAGFMLDFEELFAQGKCDKIDNSSDLNKGGALNPATFASLAAPFYYWIDGSLGSFENSTLKRARLAAYLDINVGPFNWIDAVVLTDANNLVIAAQRLTQSDVSPVSAKSPYVIFENLAFADQATHSLYFLVRSGKAAANVTVYKHELTPQKMQVSRLDYRHLDPSGNPTTAPIPGVPKKFREEMLALPAHQIVDDTSKNAELTTALHGYALPSFNHPVRVAVGTMANDQFEVRVFPMHAEQSASHYMRNIAILDPVGRVLGLLRREFNAATAAPASEFVAFVVLRGLQVQEAVANSGVLASHFTQEEKDYYTKPGSPRILDCPYIHIVVDDVSETTGKTTLRLR